MVPLVLYHAGCYDGFCAAWVARKVFPDAEFIPVQYRQDPPEAASKGNRAILILDFSYPRNVLAALGRVNDHVLVLDHHKSARENLIGQGSYSLPNGYTQVANSVMAKFNMDKSGGQLTWEHFFPENDSLWLVDYTEDRDLWRWALPDSRPINAALRSYPFDFELWDQFEKLDPKTLVPEGNGILRREKQIVDSHVSFAKETILGGHKILVVNATVLTSEIAGALAADRPFGACWFERSDGKKVWSLRSAENGVDVSEIAKKFGGGGHFHSAGFTEE